MARKRASLKDKGEEILGVKRGGQGADILFGTGTKAKPTPPEEDGTAAAPSPAEETPSEREADLDELLGAEAEAAEKEAPAPAVAEYPAAEEGLPEGEADLDEELDLDELLSAEAEAALPELATTPAAPAPPPPEPAVTLPTAAPPPPPPTYPPRGPAGAPPPAVERPAPAPPAYPPRGPASVPPPAVERPAPAPPAPSPPAPVPAVAPPSTATGAPDLTVPRPPRYIQMVGEDFDVLSEEVSADAAAAALVGAPEGIRLTAEERDRLARRTSVQKKWVELDRAIEGQYDRILRENVSVSKPITDWCQNMLAEARAIVLTQQVSKLAKAEWNVEQVRARLDRAEESRKQANRYAWPITTWGIIWFAIFVYLIFNPTLILQLLTQGGITDSFLVPDIFLRSLFFGGIGGVAAVFYHLFKYVRERSFDSQYILSYVGKPFMGMILGSIIYLTVFVMMRVVGLAPIGLQGSDTDPMVEVMYTALLFFIAMAAGFKENLAFNLLNRVIKAVLGEEKEAEELPTPPPISETTE